MVRFARRSLAHSYMPRYSRVAAASKARPGERAPAATTKLTTNPKEAWAHGTYAGYKRGYGVGGVTKDGMGDGVGDNRNRNGTQTKMYMWVGGGGCQSGQVRPRAG